MVSATPTSSTSDPNGILQKNPFRYRGYYYDNETSWYYLQSRYYNPEVKRFLNADWQFNLEDGPSGLNLFAYCSNNPVNLYDPNGRQSLIGTRQDVLPTLLEGFWEWLKATGGAAVGAAGAAAGALAPYALAGLGFLPLAGSIAYAYDQSQRGNVNLTGVIPARMAHEKADYGPKAVAPNSAIGSSPASPEPPKNDKPSLRYISESKANELAKQHGYKGAEDFKDTFAPNNGSHFNMKVDTKTGEIWLEGLRNGVQIATGLFR